MEELTEEQRLNVSKMSDDRLRRKLVQAGYREVDVAGLDRNTMLAYVARVVLAETAYVLEQAESEDKDGDGDGDGDGEEGFAVGGEMQTEMISANNRAFEERWLLLEERKLEEQRLQREERRLSLYTHLTLPTILRV